MTARRLLSAALAAACALLPGSEGWAAGARSLGAPGAGAVPGVTLTASLALPGVPGATVPGTTLPGAGLPVAGLPLAMPALYGAALPPAASAAALAPEDFRSRAEIPALPAAKTPAHLATNVPGPAGDFRHMAEISASEAGSGGRSVEATAAKGRAAFDGAGTGAPAPETPEPPRRPSRGDTLKRWTGRLTGYIAVRGVLVYPAVQRAVEELLDAAQPAAVRVDAARRLSRYARAETLEALAAAAASDREPAVRAEARLAHAAVALGARGGVPPAATALLAEPPRPRSESERAELLERARRPLRYEALKKVVGVAAVFTTIELAGAFLTHSMSLQADAMHLAADLAINVGALAAIWVATRPSSSNANAQTLKPSLSRLEPLVGLGSSLAIAGMGLFTGYEAVGRLLHPAAVPALETMLLAGAGLTSNALSTLLLYRYRDDSVSLRGAFIHAATDALGSLGIIVGSALILAFGWLWADPVISLGIVALILRTTSELALRSWAELTGRGEPPSGGGPGMHLHSHGHHGHRH